MTSSTANAVTPTILLWFTGLVMPLWDCIKPEHFGVINKLVFSGTFAISLFQSIGTIDLNSHNGVTIYAGVLATFLGAFLLIPFVFLFSPTRRWNWGTFAQLNSSCTFPNAVVIGYPMITALMANGGPYSYLAMLSKLLCLPLFIAFFELYRLIDCPKIANIDEVVDMEKVTTVKPKLNAWSLTKKLLFAFSTNPMIIGSVCGVIWLFIAAYCKDHYTLRHEWPYIVKSYFTYMANTTTPVGTIAIGVFTALEIKKMYLDYKNKVTPPKDKAILGDYWAVLFILIFKNFIYPPWAAWIVSWFTKDQDTIYGNLIISAAPVALIGFAFSTQYNYKPRVAAIAIVLNNFILFGTIPFCEKIKTAFY